MTGGLSLFATLLIVGGVPALAIGRDVARAVVLLVPLALTTAGLAGATLLFFPGSYLLHLLIVALVGNAVALRYLPRSTWSAANLVGLVPGILAALLALPQLRQHAIEWDARSIWLLHARLIFGGHATYASSLLNSAFAFSHPDYPEGAPGLVASQWLVFGHIDYLVGRADLWALNVAAISAAGLELCRLGVDRASRMVWLVLSLGFTIVAVGVGNQFIGNGYVDLLWAALAVAGVVAGLCAPPSPTNFTVAAVLVLGAASTKSDGLPVALALIVLAAIRLRRARVRSRQGSLSRPDLRLAVVALIGLGVWPLLSALHGVPGRYPIGTGLRHYSSNPSAALTRWQTLASAYLHQVPGLVAFIVLLLISVPALRAGRSATRLGNPAWLLLLGAAELTALSFAYLLDPADIDWLLKTSLARTAMFSLLLGYVGFAALLPPILYRPRPRSEVEKP